MTRMNYFIMPLNNKYHSAEYISMVLDLSGNKFQSLLVMLRDNKHLKKLKLVGDLNVLEIIKVVAPNKQWYE
jgi:hypothetical protein